MKLLRYKSYRGLLHKARDFLERNEAENCMLLGILGNPAAVSSQAGDLLWALEDSKGVCGVVISTKKLLLSRMPEAALARVVEELRILRWRLTAVLGPAEVVASFSTLWARLEDTRLLPGMGLRIYSLETLSPRRDVPGGLRPARQEDAELLSSWCADFQRETGTDPAPADRVIGKYLRDGSLYVWEDKGKPVSMTGFLGQTKNGVRISLVYTPQDARGRGYGSACVSGVSELLLARGRRYCYLYADRANPVSNSVYFRLGYKPICDVDEAKRP